MTRAANLGDRVGVGRTGRTTGSSEQRESRVEVTASNACALAVGELAVHGRADPVDFVLVSLGRKNQFASAFTGKSIAYGRAPWRLMKLSSMAIDGI